MKIRLYQLIVELDQDKLLYKCLQHMRCTYGNELPSHLYEIIYSGEVAAETLDDIVRIFNKDFPDDYRGRSLSVSDVVEVIESPINSKFYYRDATEFTEVSFDMSKAMLPIQNHNYQDTFEIRHNVRAFFVGTNGLEDHNCTKLILQRCKHSECQLGYEIVFYEFGDDKPHRRQFLTKPLIVMTQCRLRLPDDLLTYTHNRVTHRYGVA